MRPGRTVPLPVAFLVFLLASLGVLLVIAEARAQTAAKPSRDVASGPHRVLLTAPAAGGMVVGIDPETGMLVMPEPDALARLLRSREAQVRRARPAPVLHPDGTMSLDVHTWMREFVTVSAGANGKPRLRCVSGKPAAGQAISAPASPALEER